jgi:mono/diheme cytochrome c family protein
MSPGASKWLRRAGIALLVLVLLAAAAVWLGLELAQRKMQRRINVTVQPVALRDDPAAIERGRYLYASRGCVDCHGADGKGRVFLDDPNGLKVVGPHIGPGAGSVTAAYRPEDWVRSIRHGVHPTGRPLLVMPSEDYNRFTNDDLAALVAWLRHMPASDQGTAALVQFPVPVRALYGFGLIQDAAAKIDHTLPPQAPLAEGDTLAHGQYVANMCLGCHGPQLAGGRVPGGPPDWPPASRLAPGADSALKRYPDADALLKLFKTGKRPDGSAVKVMPFESLGAMSENDVRALHAYLGSLRSPTP